MSSYNSRIIRYEVSYWGHDAIVSYNTGLGAAEARRYALYNARNYGGTCVAVYADGSTEEIDTRMGTPVLGESGLKAA